MRTAVYHTARARRRIAAHRLLILPLLWTAAACGPSPALEGLACESAAQCGSARCVAGFCVAPVDPDAGGDAADPEDGDGVGDVQDEDGEGVDTSDTEADRDVTPDVGADVGSDADVADTDLERCAEDYNACEGGVCLDGTCIPNPPDFVPVPPGQFTMGSPSEERGRYAGHEDSVEVTLSYGFWAQATEVTQAQWADLMSWNEFDRDQCPQCPADNMTWFAALRYANLRSEIEQLPVCYELSTCTGTGAAETCDTVEFAMAPEACRGYRLPSEAEWEYAARAGTTTAFHAGDITSIADCDAPDEQVQDSALDAIGHYCGNATISAPVGGKGSNAWGLSDVSGNVAEWTFDAYFIALSGGRNPVVEFAVNGAPRAARGGHFASPARHCRSASRTEVWPGERRGNVGLRLVRTIHPD